VQDVKQTPEKTPAKTSTILHHLHAAVKAASAAGDNATYWAIRTAITVYLRMSHGPDANIARTKKWLARQPKYISSPDYVEPPL